MTGIVFYKPSKEGNFDSVARLAFNFNVDFIVTIEKKYKRFCADTTNAINNIPIFHFDNFESFLLSESNDYVIISIEITENASDLETFFHPKHSIYVFGGENQTLPGEILRKSHATLKVNSNKCLNMAMCAGMVLFHRHLQFFKKKI